MPKKNEGIIGTDVFYRVHQADGKKWVASARAWDVSRFQASLSKSYMEAKDGPHIVEFISAEEFKQVKNEERRGKEHQH
jgi:hypothetical protein